MQFSLPSVTTNTLGPPNRDHKANPTTTQSALCTNPSAANLNVFP